MAALRQHALLICHKVTYLSVFPTKKYLFVQHMKQMDHNGPGFQYIVNFKRLVQNPTPQVRYVQEWEVEEIVIPDQETFVPYEIFVQALYIDKDQGILRRGR